MPGCWCPPRCRPGRRSPSPTRTIRGQRPVAGAGGAPPRCCARRWRRGHSRVTLLDGVTGSGKTEVYLEAVAECLRAGPPGAGAAAGDRAVLAMAGAVRAPLRRGAGGVALRPDLADAADHLAGGGRRRGAGGGRARARRCSCRSPISAWSWSTRSTRPRSSRRRAWSTTRATWRWCGRGSARRRRCWSPPRPAWRRSPTSRPAATAGSRLPTRHGGATLPEVAAIDMRETPPERGQFLAPPLIEAVRDDAGARRAGDAVPQPPRLRAADAVPALRAPDAVPELHRLAGGAPRPARAAMPPLRPRHPDPAGVPGLRRGAQPDRRSGRAWSGSPRKPRRCSPRRGGW